MNIDLTSIGNINKYIKNMKLRNQVEQRKQSGDFTSHYSTAGNWMMEEVKRQQENDKMARITGKVLSGKKLTSEEREYLRTKNPQAYQQMLKSEQEQKAYEEELRRCETKEDVERLRINRINAALSVIKSVENNPGISAEQAMGIAMGELAKLQAYERITQEFIKSGEYAKLPTEAEERKAAKEAKEEREVSVEEKPVEEKGTETEEPIIEAEPKQIEEGEEKVADVGEKPKVKVEVEVETKEERKVQRAKAKARAVYVKTADVMMEVLEPVRKLNTKA